MSTITERRNQTPIFGAVAPAFYARGMSVIPLVYHEKRPIPNDWSRFATELPTEEEQHGWATQYYNCNIGLVLGAQSNVTGIDIDLDINDERNAKIITLIKQALPKSPWQRIGKKGMMLAYKYSGIPTFRIKDSSGKTMVEYLSDRTQFVLPPSVHPDTQLPYEANCDLLDVIDQLPVLPANIEQIIREILKDNGIELAVSGRTRVTDWVPAGSRDTKMIQVAGAFAAGVIRGERPVIEAIELMRGWYEARVEDVAGDPVDIEKGIQRMIEFIIQDVTVRGKTIPTGWDEGLSDEDKVNMGLVFTDDQTEWDFNQIKEYVRNGFELHADGTPQRGEVLEQALRKIAHNKSMSSLDRDRLMKYMTDISKEKLSIVTLRKRLKELSAGDIAGLDHTELALAVIADYEKIAPLKFYGDKFHQFNGSHWEELESYSILAHIAKEYGTLPAARRYNDHSQILKIMSGLLRSELKSLATAGVNFANGFLGQDLVLYPHSASYGATYTLPFRYLPGEAGKAPKFFDFLYKSWGHNPDYSDKLLALQEALCVTVFGMGPRYQRAIMLEGPAKSGKSQLLSIVKNLVPFEGRCACPPDLWADRFAPTSMYGKILNVCGELPEDKMINGQLFKDIISGDEIKMEYKGGQIFTGAAYCTHWFASNHLPKSKDTSEGFNRRWLFLTFDTPVPDKERILDLGEIIAGEEREGIVAWAVEALPRLLVNHEYTLPASHKERVGEMANTNNSVRFFLTDSGKIAQTKNDTDSINEFRLHNLYSSFCIMEAGTSAFGIRQFRLKMRELEREFGFKIVINIDPETGVHECLYVGLKMLSK